MKVLVLGSTGYLGNPIAEALVRSGHLVYAQTRSSKNVARLTAQELVPFASDPNTDDKYLELITSLKVDVVIESLDYSGHLLVDVFNKITKAARECRSSAYKLTYISVSGNWAHGTQPPASLIEGLDDERGQPAHPAQMMIPRVAAETNILSSSDVDGIIIRPSVFYGRAGGVWEDLFERATKAGEKGEKFEWYITEGG
ncbi:hypothetical protein BDY24DRAFT_443696 [Mrakia frigida]|uniref:uncharacterized protein n=1 Tax=Mrakia frigida TaxID=29902 RepID=UPI003FCC09AA